MISSITRVAAIIMISLMMITLFGGCFAGPDSKWKEAPIAPPKPPQAGFLAGLWHGIIAIPALILSIFMNISIYEVNNTGWFYNLGFLLGVGAFSSSGVHMGTCRRKKRD